MCQTQITLEAITVSIVCCLSTPLISLWNSCRPAFIHTQSKRKQYISLHLYATQPWVIFSYSVSPSFSFLALMTFEMESLLNVAPASVPPPQLHFAYITETMCGALKQCGTSQMKTFSLSERRSVFS